MQLVYLTLSDIIFSAINSNFTASSKLMIKKAPIFREDMNYETIILFLLDGKTEVNPLDKS
jgi:ABC-type metal ion transport system substrate-binding protein